MDSDTDELFADANEEELEKADQEEVEALQLSEDESLEEVQDSEPEDMSLEAEATDEDTSLEAQAEEEALNNAFGNIQNALDAFESEDGISIDANPVAEEEQVDEKADKEAEI